MHILKKYKLFDLTLGNYDEWSKMEGRLEKECYSLVLVFGFLVFSNIFWKNMAHIETVPSLDLQITIYI